MLFTLDILLFNVVLSFCVRHLGFIKKKSPNVAVLSFCKYWGWAHCLQYSVQRWVPAPQLPLPVPLCSLFPAQASLCPPIVTFSKIRHFNVTSYPTLVSRAITSSYLSTLQDVRLWSLPCIPPFHGTRLFFVQLCPYDLYNHSAASCIIYHIQQFSYVQ